MSDPSLAVQAALVAAIKALATEAGERVYDIAPKGAAHPYVTIGPAQTVPMDEDCWDRSENFVQVDVWSREVGFPEAKRIAGAIRDGMHDQMLTIEGHVCDRMYVRSITFSRDPDGLTSRARLDLVVDTQPI